MAERVHEKDTFVAIKVMDKRKYEYDLDMIRSEVDVLSRLDHPNIVKYLETYNDKHYIYLVQEYIEGKQLFQHIVE